MTFDEGVDTDKQGARREVPKWLEAANKEAFERARRIKKASQVAVDMSPYQDKPVEFCREKLGMRLITDDIVRLMHSVRDNVVTIARSSNAIGKSYSAGRIGLWFYLTHPDSQVYLAAAPPERNLVSILWAHVAMVTRVKPTLFTGHSLKRLRITRSPDSFIEGVTIPLQGTSEERQAKFCAYAEDEFRLFSGEVCKYKDLIGKKETVLSVDEKLDTLIEPDAEFFDNGVDDVYEVRLAESGISARRTGKHLLYVSDTRPAVWGMYADGGDASPCEGWKPVKSLREGDLILRPKSSDLASGAGEFVWDRVDAVNYVGKLPTVGVYVPRNHTYVTDLVEHNSGKHAPHLLFIVDEGDAVPEEVYKGIESCMSSGHVRLLIMFNPRAPQGLVYDMEMSGRANVVEMSAFNHPNVLTGMDVIPGAVSREVTVRRINEWSRTMARDEKVTDDCFEVPDFLVGATATSNTGVPYPPLVKGFRKVEQDELWYMTLAKYPNKGVQQLISTEWIDAAIERGREYAKKYGDAPPNGIKPVLGLDCAEFGGDNNTLCARYGSYVAEMKAWGGMDTDETTDKALEMYVDLDADILFVDALGVGSAVAPAVVRRGRYDRNPPIDVAAIGVKVSERPSKITHTDLGEFYSIRDEIWWRLREFLRLDSNAILPDDPMLAEELRSATYEYTAKGDRIKVMSKEEFRKKLRRSPDRADALCLTFSPKAKATVVGLATSHED